MLNHFQIKLMNARVLSSRFICQEDLELYIKHFITDKPSYPWQSITGHAVLRRNLSTKEIRVAKILKQHLKGINLTKNMGIFVRGMEQHYG